MIPPVHEKKEKCQTACCCASVGYTCCMEAIEDAVPGENKTSIYCTGIALVLPFVFSSTAVSERGRDEYVGTCLVWHGTRQKMPTITKYHSVRKFKEVMLIQISTQVAITFPDRGIGFLRIAWRESL